MMKTSELTGDALDWAVAKCEGFRYELYEHKRKKWDNGLYRPQQWQPSTDWAQGGPIIEREGISVMRVYKDYDEPWCAERGEEHFTEAPTPLIAAMRCYVASKLGDTIKVPPELL